MELNNNQSGIFKSKRGKMYELINRNGQLVCYSLPEHKKRQPTAEILKAVKLINEEVYIVYTDGGCEFNPGGRGGIGVQIISKHTGEIMTEISQGFISTTNNRMEIMAAIVALEAIPEGSVVYLYSDSQYTLNCMNGVWSRNKNIDLWRRLDEAVKGKRVKTKWVRGHNGNPHNERCDELATLGIRNAALIDPGYEGSPPPATKPKGAMGVEIYIENDSDSSHEIEDIFSYVNSHKINNSCALALKQFWNSDKKFKAYMALKTGGIDYWSGIRKDELIKIVGEKDFDLISKYLELNRDIESCLRWRARGLSIKDSIRKVLVDMEVSQKAGRR